MTKKDLLQQKVVGNYIREWPQRATLVLGTGMGKGKIAIDILKTILPSKVFIIVNSTNLRDTTWEEEFHKWHFGEFYDNHVTMATYQSAYKWTKETVDLSDAFIIADEVDFAADVPEYSKFFYEFAQCRILGLTGFITDSKKDWFDFNLPVFTEFSISEAQEEEILNKMHFVFVKYMISTEKDRTVEYTKDGQKNSFKTSENDAYIYAEEQIQNIRNQMQEVRDQKLGGEGDYFDLSRVEERLKKRLETLMFSRNRLLGSLASNVRIVNRLLAEIPDTAKTLVFSTSTEQSAKIVEIVYNSKQSDADNSEIFSKFNSGKIRILGVCTKIDRGVNISNLDTAIFESFYGSDTKAVQRLGRLARLSPDKKATVYILLPYYRQYNKVAQNYETLETRQVAWTRKMLETTTLYSYEIKSFIYESE